MFDFCSDGLMLTILVHFSFSELLTSLTPTWFIGMKLHLSMRAERWRDGGWKQHFFVLLVLLLFGSYHRSLFVWPALSLVLSDKPPPPIPSPPLSAFWCLLAMWRQGGTCDGTSCSPGDGCAVFLGLHAQRGDAGGLAVWINVEVVAIDSPTNPSTPKQAAHVCLSHVAAPWAGHTQEVRHPSWNVRVRGHAGGNWITWYNAARHWRGSAAAPNPWRVLDLENNIR